MKQQIYDSKGVQNFYEQGIMAYCEKENCYYDPRNGMCYESDGEEFDPATCFSQGWESGLTFRYYDGLKFFPMTQTSSRQERDKQKRRRSPSRPSRNDSHITNFLIPDTMSKCSKTKYENNHPKTNWAVQMDCSFSIKSIVENRCMYWIGNLDGHCDCVEAYDYARGQTIDTTRIERIRHSDKIREEKSQFEGLPADHHFEDARYINISELTRLHDMGDLPSYKNKKGYSIYYHKKWHVLFTGNGVFLEELTKKMRKSKETAREFLHEDKTFKG